MAKYYFTFIDIGVLIIALITYIFSICTDVLICIQFMLDGQMFWGWLMVAFIVLPAVLMNAFSFVWHVHDKTVNAMVIISHLFLCAPIHRYLKGIIHGVSSMKTRKAAITQIALKEQSDATILRLFESFLECAPQLVLQCFILLFEKSVMWFVGLSSACSLISLTWSMTSYTDSQRRIHPTKSSKRIIRLLLHWGWQLFVTTSRIAALVFFAGTVHFWVLALIGCHWLVAFLWLSLMGTDFGTGHWEKWMYRVVCAFMYVFVFLNVNDGASRWRITAYYMLMFLENTGMVVVFMVLGDGADMVIFASLIVFVGFFLGLMFMMLYYEFLRRYGQSHQGKRFHSSSHRASVISGSSLETGSQIFSVEFTNPVDRMQETVINVDQDATPPENMSASGLSSWISRQSPVNSRYSGSEGNRSQLSLQKVWQSGMISSSSSTSSSSLLSVVDSVNSGVRTPSIKSAHSHNSVSSENNLLTSAAKTAEVFLKNFNRENHFNDHNHSANLSVTNENLPPKNASGNSPSLSRSSWARSSDVNRQSVIMEDFTVLGFDDSSSTDRKNSDSSSFSSHPKSMSPLNVSVLWKDVHSRLRQTIAATVAAATGNSSSTEATPVKSHSTSLTSTENSLNSSLRGWNLSHNTAFMESMSSYKEDSSRQNVSTDSARREALVSLPDIIEALNHQDHMSDTSFSENTFVKFSDSSFKTDLSSLDNATPKTESKVNQSNFSKLSTNSFPDDSTLTLSKLGMIESSSFNQRQKQQPVFSNSERGHQSKSSNHSKSSPALIKENQINKEGSPFSEQELVQVMACSLQSYIGASSSYDANVREGLALTIEDLRFSRETSPEQSPQSVGKLKKSRSASSLFHDSTESSPASSASRMNQVLSAQKGDKFSPNGLKIIDHPFEKKFSVDSVGQSEIGSNSCLSTPHSLALKFLMDAYGPSTPISHKSLHFSGSIPIHSAMSITDEKILSRRSRNSSGDNERHSSNVWRQSLNKQQLPIHKKDTAEFSERLSKRRSKSSCNVREPTRSAVSYTKKLSVHFSPSPSKQSYLKSQTPKNVKFIDSDSGSDVGYVAGHYCPPLCSSDRTTDSPQMNESGSSSIASSLNSKSDRFQCNGKIVANKSLPNLEFYSPSIKKNCEANITPRDSHRHNINSLTEDELKQSARLVANYFSEALETSSHKSIPKKHLSQPQLLHVHRSPRQPLQSLENSPHFSPEHTHPSRGHLTENKPARLFHRPESVLNIPKRPNVAEYNKYIVEDRLLTESISQLDQTERLVLKPPIKKSDLY